MPNHYVGDLLHTMAMSGFSRVRTELSVLSLVPQGTLYLDMRYRFRPWANSPPAP
jgi:hypothetical protein